MKFLLNVHVNSENYDSSIYAVVDITPSVAALILRRQQLFNAADEQDEDLYELTFWGCDCTYYTAGSGEDEKVQALLDKLGDGGYLAIEADFTPADAIVRTECDTMLVRRFGVSWKCFPRHTESIEFETAEIPYGVVGKLYST